MTSAELTASHAFLTQISVCVSSTWTVMFVQTMAYHCQTGYDDDDDDDDDAE